MTEIIRTISAEDLFKLLEEAKNVGIVAMILAIFAIAGLAVTVLLLTQGDKKQ